MFWQETDAKKPVSKTSFKRHDELYKKLGTREGEKEIYRLVKVREKQSKDFQKV